MIAINCPDLRSLRHWMLCLDARLMTPEIHARWLASEKEARIERLNITMSMLTLGYRVHSKGGLA